MLIKKTFFLAKNYTETWKTTSVVLTLAPVTHNVNTPAAEMQPNEDLLVSAIYHPKGVKNNEELMSHVSKSNATIYHQCFTCNDSLKNYHLITHRLRIFQDPALTDK